MKYPDSKRACTPPFRAREPEISQEETRVWLVSETTQFLFARNENRGFDSQIAPSMKYLNMALNLSLKAGIGRANHRRSTSQRM
jgi:hypothetical protein